MNLAEFEKLLNDHWLLLFVLMAWSLVWKGIALWQAAHRDQRWWFIFILLINSVGILELVYIFFVPRPKKPEVADMGASAI